MFHVKRGQRRTKTKRQKMPENAHILTIIRIINPLLKNKKCVPFLLLKLPPWECLPLISDHDFHDFILPLGKQASFVFTEEKDKGIWKQIHFCLMGFNWTGFREIVAKIKRFDNR